jgi:DNA repair protein RecO (recombination protein O)
MSEREEVLLERAFVLHQRPFRNTSQLVDCLTDRHGRMGLVARGSRRIRSGQRALLQPFMPLKLSWVRRGELGNLTHVEAESKHTELRGDRLLAGFYVNELVLRLLARGDANSEVFSCYSACLLELASGIGIARSLRLFELGLLHALGLGLPLDRDFRSDEPLHPDWSYVFELENGLTRAPGHADGDDFHGRDLISLREKVLDSADSLRAAKLLLGRVLHTYLGDRPLKSRSVFKAIVDRGLDR